MFFSTSFHLDASVRDAIKKADWLKINWSRKKQDFVYDNENVGIFSFFSTRKTSHIDALLKERSIECR